MDLCRFCQVTVDNGFEILWEDSEFIAFEDRDPAAEHHIQVVPKHHIDNVRVLTKNETGLVQSMATIGDRLLDSLGVIPEDRIMGFHIPPFNTVNHLHLHVQAPPYKGDRGKKYRVARGFGPFIKGFSWFITAEQAIRTLERGSSIGIIPW
ncbi:Oxalate decarboxylase [Mycena kentingensis (nom. inval.)]|nr:Oxalate decarboxylase [Mycena kentingensis (nom. inval.)]